MPKPKRNPSDLDRSVEFSASDEVLEFDGQDSEQDHMPGMMDRKIKVKMVNGEEMSFHSLKALQSSDHFMAIMTSAKNGDVFSINFPIRAFVDKPNRNNVRPLPGQLPVAATTAPGKPLLEDHATYRSSSEKGVVVYSEITKFRGKDALDVEVSARDPEFQVQYLRGLRRRYSASFEVGDKLMCSSCEEYAKRDNYGRLSFECGHYPGQHVGGKVVEWMYSVRSFAEVSSTPYPAVEDAKAIGGSFSQEGTMPEDVMEVTRVEELAAQASELRAQIAQLTAERDDLRQKYESSQKSAREMGVKYLQSKRIVFSVDERARLDRLFVALGVDETVAHYESFAPNMSLAATPAGSDSAPAQGTVALNSARSMSLVEAMGLKPAAGGAK